MRFILSRAPRIYRYLYLFNGILIIFLWLGGAQALSSVSIADAESEQPPAHITSIGANFSLSSASDPSGDFIFQGLPGTLMHDSVRVTNIGDAIGTVNLYAVDGITAETSGVIFPSHTVPQHNIGAWITLDRHQLTLAPGQHQDVPFVLNIPSHQVRTGQYGGGIVAEFTRLQKATARNQQSSGLTIHILQRFVIGVHVTLPGPLHANLQTTGVAYRSSTPNQTVQVELHNTGNMIIHPYGYLRIRDGAGNLLQDLPLKLFAILPQDSILYPVYIRNKALQPGTYQAELMLQYEQNRRLYITSILNVPAPPVPFFSPPPKLVSLSLSNQPIGIIYYVTLAAALFLLGGGILYWIYRRKSASK